MDRQIAVLGRGSLIGDPRNLKVLSNIWQINGPKLPLEFARISQDQRVTLVIDALIYQILKKWTRCCWNYWNISLDGTIVHL